jgi:hypothetical protein
MNWVVTTSKEVLILLKLTAVAPRGVLAINQNARAAAAIRVR